MSLLIYVYHINNAIVNLNSSPASIAMVLCDIRHSWTCEFHLIVQEHAAQWFVHFSAWDFRSSIKLLLHTRVPSYLTNHLIPYVPGTPNLRSGDDKSLLVIPRTKRTHSDKTFSTIASCLCGNSLPLHIRSCPSITGFRKLLEAHLFPHN